MYWKVVGPLGYHTHFTVGVENSRFRSIRVWDLSPTPALCSWAASSRVRSPQIDDAQLSLRHELQGARLRSPRNIICNTWCHVRRVCCFWANTRRMYLVESTFKRAAGCVGPPLGFRARLRECTPLDTTPHHYKPEPEKTQALSFLKPLLGVLSVTPAWNLHSL